LTKSLRRQRGMEFAGSRVSLLTEAGTLVKRGREAQNKVFARLFQKAVGSRGKALGRARRRGTPPAAT